MRRMLVTAIAVIAVATSAPVPVAADTAPALSVDPVLLEDALHCPDEFVHHDREPVLLVHGTTVTAEENWDWNWLPVLDDIGFDVCTVDLPRRAMVDIQESSEYVVYAIRHIAQATGRLVDVAGLSQGGLQPRWAVRWWPDVRASVDDLVNIVTPNHGIGGADFLCANGCAPPTWQMKVGSAFLNALNAEDETPGDIDYTSVYSLTDPVVNPQVPESTSALDDAENIAVQDVCPGRFVDHVQSAYDAVVFALTVDAFSRIGPADRWRVDQSVCARPFMPGIDPVEAAARHVIVYAYGLPMASGLIYAERTDAEPPLRPYAR